VVDRRHLAAAIGPRRRDHFLLGRLSQAVEVVWARDADARVEAEDALRAARSRAFDWVAPFLPSVFDAEDLGRRMLEVSYATELRPEERDRVVVTFDGWLDYAVDKVERRAGQTVRLGRLERRWPLILLWPRVFRIFRARSIREDLD